jgi:hypothetical protein
MWWIEQDAVLEIVGVAVPCGFAPAGVVATRLGFLQRVIAMVFVRLALNSYSWVIDKALVFYQ